MIPPQRRCDGCENECLGVLTITFFTRPCALEFHHVIALRVAFTAISDAIDAAHRFKSGRTIADCRVCKINAHM